MGFGFQLRLLVALLLAAPLAASSAPAPHTELGRLTVKNYAPRAYSAHYQIWAVAQDQAGMVYFGCDPQVITFDGATWRKVPIPGATDSIRGLAVAPDGRVYVGGINIFGWLRPLENSRHEFVSLVEHLPESERDFERISQILPVGDTIYAVARNKILVWREGKFSVLPSFLNSRLSLVRGVLYLHSNNQPLRRIDGDRITIVSRDPVFLANAPTLLCAAPESDQALILATREKGLFTLQDNRLTPRPTEVDAFLRGKRMLRALQLPDGEIALCTEEAGMVFITPQGRFLHALNDQNGLQVSRVYALAPDREGGLWLGLNGGIAHVDSPSIFTSFDSTNGLPNSGINDIIRHQGSLYVATLKDLYRLEPATTPSQSARFEAVLKGEFFAFYSDGVDLLVAGNRKLYQQTSAGLVPVLSLPNSAVYVIQRSRQNPDLFWLGTQLGMRAALRTAEGWRDQGAVPEINEAVRSVVESADGRIWGSTTGDGVFRITPSREGNPSQQAKVEKFSSPDEQARMVRALAWGPDTIFTANRQKTLFSFDEATGQFRPFGGIGKLPGDVHIGTNIFGTQNADGLWLTRTYHNYEDKRIYHAARGGAVRALPQSVSETLGGTMRFYEEPGVLWIGGSDCLMRVEIARAFQPSPDYAARVWTRGLDIRDGDQVPYGRSSFDFEFTAPRYAPTYPLKYQSRLIGDNEVWSAPSTDTKRTYTHLDAGTYRFEVRARDVDDHVSTRATLSFTILPPWWRTWWAYGGYGVAFTGALLGFARLRTRALRRKNEQLEKTVATRTEDLRRQNGELARLHKLELDEKISARLAVEKAQLDVLRYQLNPHFLFNSLTSIRSQIPPGQGSARNTVDRLADFCRLTLQGHRVEEQTTIGEEIAMLRAYLDIEQTRLGELLSVEFSVDPALDATLLPRLLLLPLVENALKYGQATSTDTLGLRISAQRSGAAVVFEISNTGEWVDRGSRPGIPSTGIGHDNLRERLRRHYPEAHAFTHSAKDGWVHVRLELTPSPHRS